MKILALSDIEIERYYNPDVVNRCKDIDLIVSCGDLSYYYLEYILTMLNKPLYYVRGNHAKKLEYGVGGDRTSPWGAIDLHRKCICDPSGILLAGIEGSIRYNQGDFQYTQTEMWQLVFSLVPALLFNRIRYGRYLDVFVSHTPPWHIHDQEDRPHHGAKSFLWFLKTFKPTYHLHGHIHVYTPNIKTDSIFESTRIINAYGSKVIHLDIPSP